MPKHTQGMNWTPHQLARVWAQIMSHREQAIQDENERLCEVMETAIRAARARQDADFQMFMDKVLGK